MHTFSRRRHLVPSRIFDQSFVRGCGSGGTCEVALRSLPVAKALLRVVRRHFV